MGVMLGKDAQFKADVGMIPCDWCGGQVKTPRMFLQRKPGEDAAPEPAPEPAG